MLRRALIVALAVASLAAGGCGARSSEPVAGADAPGGPDAPAPPDAEEPGPDAAEGCRDDAACPDGALCRDGACVACPAPVVPACTGGRLVAETWGHGCRRVRCDCGPDRVLVEDAGACVPGPDLSFVLCPFYQDGACVVRIADVPLGARRGALVTLANTGGLALTVREIRFTPSTSAEFRVEATIPVVVPPGGRVPIEVVYEPADLGADFGTLELLSDTIGGGRTVLPVMGSTAALPCETAAACLPGQDCGAEGLCRDCPPADVPPCSEGTVVAEETGRSCERWRCLCPDGEVYLDGDCVEAASCATDGDCPEGRLCRTGLCPDEPCTGPARAGCVPGEGPCVPDCEGRECGPSGCSGVECGACPADRTCDTDGRCRSAERDEVCCRLWYPIGIDGPEWVWRWLPAIECQHRGGAEVEEALCADGCHGGCGERQCGDDGCGGSCGVCPDGSVCLANGYCWREPEPRPDPVCCRFSGGMGAPCTTVAGCTDGLVCVGVAADRFCRRPCDSDAPCAPDGVCVEQAVPGYRGVCAMSEPPAAAVYRMRLPADCAAEGEEVPDTLCLENCRPECNIRQCGLDPCGYRCGDCFPPLVCSFPAGLCGWPVADAKDVCCQIDDGRGAACLDDTDCAPWLRCVLDAGAVTCRQPCNRPDQCPGAVCTPAPSTSAAGFCPGGPDDEAYFALMPRGDCEARGTEVADDWCPTVCLPNCADRECGDNGCGRACGQCEAPGVCGSDDHCHR